MSEKQIFFDEEEISGTKVFQAPAEEDDTDEIMKRISERIAEEEEIEVNVDGNWVRCWHIENDGEIATICLGYLGGPRTQVPLSSLRHPE